MRTDADRIRFAVEFVRQSALQVNARDLARLRRGLEAFLGLTREGIDPPSEFGIEVAVVRPPFPRHASKALLFGLQGDAYQMISSAIDGTGVTGPTVISDDQELCVDVVGRAGPRTMRIGGSMRAGFLLTLAVLLASTVGEKVMRCPECGNIFIRVRRQKYCKAQCTDRATWRNYPAEKKRRNRRAEYERNGWTQGARTKDERTTR